MSFTDPTADRTPRCLLIYNDPGHPATPGGAGWLLVTAVGTEPPATVALASHGADRHTGPRAAKVVATRVLAQHGHEVAEWHDRSTAPPVFRAVLHPGSTGPLPDDPPAPETADALANPAAPAAPAVRVRRLGRVARH